MQYQLITDVLNAIETIQLYEDMVGRDLDSDWEDDDYNPAFDPCVLHTNDEDPCEYCSMSTPMSPVPACQFGYPSAPLSPHDMFCPGDYAGCCPDDYAGDYPNAYDADMYAGGPIFEDTVPDMEFMYEPFCEHNVDTENYTIMDGPCCAPISFPFGNQDGSTGDTNVHTDGNATGPSTKPLRKCFYRQPNDKFHETDPYMYYEATDHPNDDEYFTALFTLSQADEAICSNEDFEQLRFEPFHLYVMAKRDNIDTRLTRKQWRVIADFFRAAERLQASVLTEIDRIEDLQWTRDDW